MTLAHPLDALGRTVEQAYTRVHREHMQALPVSNPALQVHMVGPRAWQEFAVGVLVTPWCMNVVALPLPGTPPLEAVRAGCTRELALPSGSYELLGAHLPELGHHFAGSLFSPMQDFDSQEQAVQAAQAALDLVLAPPPAVADAPGSRRSFLFGARSGPRDTTP